MRLRLLFLLPLCLGSSLAWSQTSPLPFEPIHLELEIHPDLAARSFTAVETLTFKAAGVPLRDLTLDADGPQIDAIETKGVDRGVRLQYRLAAGQLHIRLPHPLPPGAEAGVVIRYHCTPRGGMVFFPGDLTQPGQATYLWVAGEPTSNRLWLPILDRPDAKLTADFHIQAPAGDRAIANGKLMGVRTLADGSQEFHWAQTIPISDYLLTLYVGRWTTALDRSASGVPLEYVTTPDESVAEARLRFGRTPAMIAFDEAHLGVPYPWAKYAEVRNPGFFAGLENVSATEFPGDFPSNADAANLQEAARGEDVGVAHELAHQWFGDLVTCRDWSQLWVNEGMANFMMQQWDEQANGTDRALLDWEDIAQGYLRNEGPHPRPVVHQPDDPWDMFSATTYNKGSWAVRNLEDQVGADAFWKGLHLYLTRYRAGAGDTTEFEQAMEQASGRDLHAFFQQWFLTAGHPQFDFAWQWDATAKLARLTLDQKSPRPYQGSIRVAAWVAGREIAANFQLDQTHQNWTLALPGPPTRVQLDPEHEWLKTVVAHRTAAEWQDTAQHARYAVDRIEAWKALSGAPPGAHTGALPAPSELTGLLQAAIQTDPSVAVQDAALQILVKSNPTAAAPLALARLQARDADERQTAAAMLAISAASPAAIASLQQLFMADPIAAVRATALRALLAQDGGHAARYIEQALSMKSYEWQVESAALQALGKQGATALPVLLRWSAPEIPTPARRTALAVLGVAGKGSPAVLARLRAALAGPVGDTQIVAAFGLARLGDKASQPMIADLAAHEWIGFYRAALKAAAAQLR